MAEILYQHLSRENAGAGLLHPLVREIRRTMEDPVLFDTRIREFINETSLVPIPEKLAKIDALVERVRDTAETWGLVVTVRARQHCILIEIELDGSRDLTFLCDLSEFADHIAITEDSAPLVQIRYFTHGFCRNGELL